MPSEEGVHYLLLLGGSIPPDYVVLHSYYYFYTADVDECLTNNGGCNQTCANTFGSFDCSCGTGFTLAADNLNCDGTYIIESKGLTCKSSHAVAIVCMYMSLFLDKGEQA